MRTAALAPEAEAVTINAARTLIPTEQPQALDVRPADSCAGAWGRSCIACGKGTRRIR
jgi:hypothetical protein